MRMLQTALISTSGLKSDVTIVFWTQISYMMREFRRFCRKLGLYCIIFCNAHVRNCLISTSSLKSDVIIVFFDPNFI